MASKQSICGKSVIFVKVLLKCWVLHGFVKLTWVVHVKQDPYFSCEILRKHSSLSTLILNLSKHIWLSIQIQFSWLKLYQFSTYCYVGHRCNNYCEENRGWQLTSKVINLWEVCDIRGGTYFEWAWASDVNWHQWWTEAKVGICWEFLPARGTLWILFTYTAPTHTAPIGKCHNNVVQQNFMLVFLLLLVSIPRCW